jgi:type III restriction enzyme
LRCRVAIQILVINIDAFRQGFAPRPATTHCPWQKRPKKKSKGNVINQVRETGIKPIEFIQAAHPIVILDEPQNLETDNRKQAIARSESFMHAALFGHTPQRLQPDLFA